MRSSGRQRRCNSGAYLWTQRQRSCEKLALKLLGRSVAEEISPVSPKNTNILDARYGLMMDLILGGPAIARRGARATRSREELRCAEGANGV